VDKLQQGVMDAYAKGKITDQQYENLKNEISLQYKEISSLNNVSCENDDNSLDIIKNEITDAHTR
jgi:hypothetical protein